MGRTYGGIEESTLLEVIRSTLQDHISYSDDDVRKIIKQVEDLEDRLLSETERIQKTLDDMNHRFDKLNSIVVKRPDPATLEAQMQALQLNLKQKADLAEVTEKMSRMDSKMESKLEADLAEVTEKMSRMDNKMERKMEASERGLEGRFTVLLGQKAEIEDIEDKFRTLYDSMEKVETGELLERIMIAEQCMQEKADVSFVDAEANALKQAIHMKADNADMEERFEDIKQRLRIKAEVASVDEKLSVLHQRLHRKVEVADVQACEDRIDRFEHKLQEVPAFDSIMERVDQIERKMQQKADNAAIDASLDDLEKMLQQKADDSIVQDRISGIDCRLQSKADAQVIASRLGGLEQRLMREAEDINHIKQELGTKVDAAFVASTVSANQVYIMQEVETMNITQNKQFNVMNNNHAPSSGSAGSGHCTPTLQQEPRGPPPEGKPRLALQNSGHTEQQVNSSRAHGQRSLARAARNDRAQHQAQQQVVLQQPALQQQPLQQPAPTPRGAGNKIARMSRSKTPPPPAPLVRGEPLQPVRSRSANRAMSRSVSCSRLQGGHSDLEAHPPRSNRRTASSMSRFNAVRGESVLGPGGWRAYPEAEGQSRTAAAPSRERRGFSVDRLQLHRGSPSLSPLRRGDTTPPRYRSRSTESMPRLRGKGHSRSGTPDLASPASDYSYDGAATPPKNLRLTAGSIRATQQGSGRIWACKRM